ncbi:MAG: hypothetical protein IM537_09710 [Pseudanabaena sp. M57BS1SP1A06MG]|nr:hypothetical protein [Pseudanabaena sp. M34BS1SP1A06MG]MCA6592570.1 hypothetical protein [Pseudanabaena sp. M38BS1SP1A06MG]MCA6600464.1 hypothetical protein [Pseudanabaena sp. M57BS1SP1A06MG]
MSTSKNRALKYIQNSGFDCTGSTENRYTKDKQHFCLENLCKNVAYVTKCKCPTFAIVATTNVGHLERFINAKYWQAIA